MSTEKLKEVLRNVNGKESRGEYPNCLLVELSDISEIIAPTCEK